MATLFYIMDMFYCDIKINSNCGLSQFADFLESTVNVTYVNPLSKGQNLVFSYAKTPLKNEQLDFQANDFINRTISGVGKFIVMNSLKKGHGITYSIIENGGIPVFPVVIGSGIENVSCIVQSRDAGELILQSIEKKRNHVEDFTISRMGQEDFAALMNRNFVPLYGQLTTMEFEILRSAISNGYYQWPREYNLDDISGRFKIKKPTVLYHLRNAERKVLSMVFR